MPPGIFRPRLRPARKAAPSRHHKKIAAVAAPVLTLGVIGAGIAVTAPDAIHLPLAAADGNADAAGAAAISRAAITSAERSASISRSFNRAATPEVTGKFWTTRELKLRLTPAKDAESAGDYELGKRIPVTGTTRGDYTQVVVAKKVYWVTSEYLSKKKPAGLDFAPCADGSGIEGGLQPAAVRVYRAVCNAFPELSRYGGQDGHGEHVNGQAIDFMVSGATGDRVRDYLFTHRYTLDLFDIIWKQRIWTIQRDGEGFRGMSNRGSATANHFDHVHIKVN